MAKKKARRNETARRKMPTSEPLANKVRSWRASVGCVFDAFSSFFCRFTHAFAGIFEVITWVVITAAAEKDGQRQGKHEESDLVFGFLFHIGRSYPIPDANWVESYVSLGRSSC